LAKKSALIFPFVILANEAVWNVNNECHYERSEVISKLIVCNLQIASYLAMTNVSYSQTASF